MAPLAILRQRRPQPLQYRARGRLEPERGVDDQHTAAPQLSGASGIAHREPGVGQIGAGVTHAPLACFTQATAALASVVSS